MVLAILLGAGCVYYLVHWLYGRRVQQQQRNLDTIYELGEKLLLSEETGGAYKQAASVTASLADASHASILILNAGAHQLEYVGSTTGASALAVSLSAISGPVTCLRNKAITEVPDAENCPFVKQETVRRLGQKSLLYAPILNGGDCVGVIEIEDRVGKRIFTGEQKARVSHVAKLIALGLRAAEERSIREQLRRTEQLTAIGELSDGLTKALNHSLEKARGLAEDCPWEESRDARVACLQTIRHELDRALQVVQELSQLRRSRRPGLETVDLSQMLTVIADQLRASADSQTLLNLDLPKRAHLVMADREQLEQALLHLVRHAERLLGYVDGDSLQISVRLLERHVLISITPLSATDSAADSGTVNEGEEEVQLAALRLAICRTLIEGFGGTLAIKADSPQRFSIEIEYPLAKESWSQPPANGQAARIAGSPGTPLTALVIDSDESTQDLLLKHLTARGHRVVPVSTEEEGLDLCRQMPFDWVFCEVGVGRMGGLQIYQQVRSRVGKFIFLADERVATDSLAVLSGEGRAVLRKPIQPEQIDQLLDPGNTKPIEVHEAKAAKV